MRATLRRWWPALKVVLGLVILFVIGRQFARDLRRPELWERRLHPGWLALTGVLYLLGLALSALFWRRLLAHFGHRPPFWLTLRAYYLGHLGKYLPGKAWALFLRGGLVQGAGVPMGVAALTSAYEVLTTMASGALVAAVLFAGLGARSGAGLDWDAVQSILHLQPPRVLTRDVAVLLALGLLAGFLFPLLPPVFNRISRRLTPSVGEGMEGKTPDARSESATPRAGMVLLLEGLLITSGGWLLLGASLTATLFAILGIDFPWTALTLARLPAVMSLSYVAGFIILIAPGALGVRELFLTLFLTPELTGLGGLDEDTARAMVILAALVLRLTWTSAELLAIAVLYRFVRSP